MTNTPNGHYCSKPFADIAIKDNQTGETNHYQGTSGMWEGYDIEQAVVEAVDAIPEI